MKRITALKLLPVAATLMCGYAQAATWTFSPYNPDPNTITVTEISPDITQVHKTFNTEKPIGLLVTVTREEGDGDKATMNFLETITNATGAVMSGYTIEMLNIDDGSGFWSAENYGVANASAGSTLFTDLAVTVHGYEAVWSNGAILDGGTFGAAFTVNVLWGQLGIGDVKAFDLVQTPTLVPIPAAVWLFGSGLLGLIGVARKKSRV